jgi:hypothetical protein
MTTVQLAFPDPNGSLFGKPVYCYSREQAIDDGVLVDVTEVAQQVGFRHPVAISFALDDRLQPSHHDMGQDGACSEERRDARLWDVLWVAALSVRLNNHETDSVRFTVTQQETDPKTGQLQNVDLRLWAVCGPGDEGEPVITIGFPQDF